MSAESSRTTHASLVCLDSCRIFGLLIALAINGMNKDELLNFELTQAFWYDNHDALNKVVAGSYKGKMSSNIRAGSVVECLEVALWALYSSNDFKTGMLLTVNLGDDTDTAGAIYGQLAGAIYGKRGIPQEWIDGLYNLPLIEGFATRLANCATNYATNCPIH
jgi:ADP-ribosyl-[dinitrogen reductase] hydrolase